MVGSTLSLFLSVAGHFFRCSFECNLSLKCNVGFSRATTCGCCDCIRYFRRIFVIAVINPEVWLYLQMQQSWVPWVYECKMLTTRTLIYFKTDEDFFKIDLIHQFEWFAKMSTKLFTLKSLSFSSNRYLNFDNLLSASWASKWHSFT